MSRRRLDARKISISKLTTYFLLLPLVLAKPQQDANLYESQSEDGQARDLPISAESLGKHQDGPSLGRNQVRNLKEAIIDSDRESAIATLAPASNQAVRAPRSAQGADKSAGLSSLLNARSLQDWEVEDFILLATVDGSIYARDRNTGAARWALEVDKPMVETIYHRQNKSSIENYRPEDDFLWIVEPSRDGEIYIFNQGRNSGLQRLRLTVKRLAEDLSPYAGEDPAVVYTAEKKTTLYTIDAGTGTITKMFSSRGSALTDDRSCRRISGLESPEDMECGSFGSLELGRTEYTVKMQYRDSGEDICTLLYSEWGPNNRDSDLHGQYSSTMDRKYVYPRHDGSIFSLDHAKFDEGRKLYTQKFSSPVVRVFDVARPSDSESLNTELIILPQPIGPMDDGASFTSYEVKNRIFVNQTETGGWYAMSEGTYPLATGGAPRAQCYSMDMIYGDQTLSWKQRQQTLVGVHSLAERISEGDRGFMTISGPPTDADLANDTPELPGPKAFDSPSSFILQSRIIGSAAANFTDIVIGIFMMMLTAFLVINYRPLSKFLRRNLELKRVFPEIEQRLGSVPSSPIVTTIPKDIMQAEDAPQVESATQREGILLSSGRSRRNTLLEPPPAGRGRSSTIEEDRGRRKSGPHVTIQEPSLSPGPHGDDDGAETPTPGGKKKARRGCRGGNKHKKKRASSKAEEPENVERTVEEVMQIAKEPSTVEPDVVEVDGTSSVVDVSGPIIQIGHLRVLTDSVLGFGSHGTIVYKGTFGERDVAVKRMLLEFYDIASHEVGLLQESDDHPNVIRYYDKESAGEFLYIALELCPASLQDVIEKPNAYPSLIGMTGLDLPDVLKQITSGLRHLHSLKIVHRDIKPQNILVSAPKKLPANPNLFQPPRLLISDFGLCKKLEGDQSSFRATTAHAAGTSGWRAPELLVDEDATSANGTAGPASTSSVGPSTHSNSEPVVLDTQTNRRATRAIDIFSLGCVFYYVLTGGAHPFDRDGKYMREANIVKGRHALGELATLGDYQWEAKDLIARMLAHDPRARPDAAAVLAHPFFWPPARRLDFLCHVSDQFEFEPREPASAALGALEALAPAVLAEAGGDFLRVLPREFRETLGKQRKYVGGRMLDLLRALRNKKNHYEDMPEAVKEKVGGLPEGYLGFWTRRFPSLLMVCHEVVREVGWEGKDRFRSYYAV